MRRRGGPQRFSEEFRREAVRLIRETDRSAKAVAAELGVSVTTLRNWLGTIPAGNPTAAGRVLSLEEQVRQLKILKKATAFFAKERR